MSALAYHLIVLEGDNHYLQFLIYQFNKLQEAKLKPLDTQGGLEVIGLDQTQPNRDFTLARQNLAIHYLLKHSRLGNDIDKTNVARLIQLITGREGNKAIKDTRIYKFAKSPLMSDKNVKQDLQFIRPYFENLGLQAIVDDINKEINS